jgi:hypothetical protein
MSGKPCESEQQMDSPPQSRNNGLSNPDLLPLLPRLHAETLAQFDPVSGLLVVNVSQADFLDAFMRWAKKEDSDTQLISAINHETYHYFQTIAAGFPFQYTADMVRIIIQHQHSWRGDFTNYFRNPSVPPEEYRSAEAWLKLFQEQLRLWQLGERAKASGDPLLFSALAPELYPALEQLASSAKAPKTNGLSAVDLIEGSAIIYQHALSFGREGLENRLDSVWHDYDEAYRRAYDFARTISGARTLDVILPSIALALRYANPPDAFPYLLSHLNSSPLGGEITEARALARNPPKLHQAGEYLGTALDVRKRWPSMQWFGLYDSDMNDLSSQVWNIDEIDLLADPDAAEKVSSFKFGFVTRDGALFGGSTELVAMRLILGGIAFRSLSLPRYVREVQRRLRVRARHGENPAQAASSLNISK